MVPVLFDNRSWRESDINISRLVISILTTHRLQVVWATVMSQGSPYLLSLGLHPSLVSLVWLAGPICGSVLQPYIGYRSDCSTHRWGRRRPFIVYGTAATIFCISLLAWSNELVNLSCGLLGITRESAAIDILKRAVAVFWVWGLNIAIQPVQAGIRALIVDSCPAEQQVQASSITSSIVFVGSVVGYGCGLLEIPKGSNWVTHIEFKGFCLVASICLGVTVAITSTLIQESQFLGAEPKMEIGHCYRDILKTVSILPERIKAVCVVQFFSWLAWFPFLFFISTYVNSSIHCGMLGIEYQVVSTRIESQNFQTGTFLHNQATRNGTLAMLLFAIVALLTSLGLPYVVSEGTLANLEAENVGLVGRKAHWFSLSRAWTISHIVTTASLLGTSLTNGFICAVIFTAVLGTSWALTQWAPFAIIGAEIARAHEVMSKGLDILSPSESCSFIGDCSRTRLLSQELDLKAATIMGVHNIAIAMPQIVAAIVGSVVFWSFGYFELGEIVALAWMLRIGCFSAAAAAYLSFRLN
ncbi:hypothetical protein B0O99DRAFT_530724 [Bisporella sp. PMI_857]|nr:hypothetical protein B0O99DRAFT_530724 [Bisporella sp. PMI_857]